MARKPDRACPSQSFAYAPTSELDARVPDIAPIQPCGVGTPRSHLFHSCPHAKWERGNFIFVNSLPIVIITLRQRLIEFEIGTVRIKELAP